MNAQDKQAHQQDPQFYRGTHWIPKTERALWIQAKICILNRPLINLNNKSDLFIWWFFSDCIHKLSVHSSENTFGVMHYVCIHSHWEVASLCLYDLKCSLTVNNEENNLFITIFCYKLFCNMSKVIFSLIKA